MSLAVALYRGLSTYYRKMAEKRAHGGKQFVVEVSHRTLVCQRRFIVPYMRGGFYILLGCPA